mmetsp:Transcript_19951/g.37555  ORF Transcript_19951/g.37555 Transcript_19951/m.37555 type:complete len:90 (-) Transcript_19951:39-308(-)
MPQCHAVESIFVDMKHMMRYCGSNHIIAPHRVEYYLMALFFFIILCGQMKSAEAQGISPTGLKVAIVVQPWWEDDTRFFYWSDCHFFVT